MSIQISIKVHRLFSFRPLALAVAALMSTPIAGSAEANLNITHPNRITYDARGFQIEGEDVFLFSGTFHYFRCPKELWASRFQKMKEAGFVAVESYVPWNWHERTPPSSVDDLSKISGLEVLDEWLTMAERFGFYVIIRPGPYICSEWAGGGFPQWLVALKKPSNWPNDKLWLRSDDAEFLAWSKHWYRAVCPVVAKHQITRKAPGQPGVVLFQIENEYDYTNVPSAGKKRHLEVLAEAARAGGIDVPLFTCVTREARNVKQGPLRGLFDMMNFYPRWEVRKSLSKTVPAHIAQQPDAPVASAETQASREPVQMQNLTLYEIQLGFSAINYWMAFGGTNFDDWASREWTTTYDSTYTVRENGGVAEKFQRTSGIARMLRDHGARLIHSEPVKITVSEAEAEVQFAERRSKDGSRFIFVRTDDRNASHRGTARIADEAGVALSIPYELEPFGSQVLWLPPGVTDAAKGEWLPKPGSLPSRPGQGQLPAPIEFKEALRISDPVPKQWTRLLDGDLLEKHGIFDYHPVYYRVSAPSGHPFTVQRLGPKVVRDLAADSVCAFANGRLLPIKSQDKEGVTFEMPEGAATAFVLLENRGRDYVMSTALEKYWNLGTTGIESGGKRLPLEFAVGERERGIWLSNPKNQTTLSATKVAINESVKPAPDALLTWYCLNFELPARKSGLWIPWSLQLDALGNGFIYLNGHCIGRTWEHGTPSGVTNKVFIQRDFYLPECWLNFGPGARNTLAISLLPLEKGVALHSASLRPLADFAELRAE